jgi:hypothetical protein
MGGYGRGYLGQLLHGLVAAVGQDLELRVPLRVLLPAHLNNVSAQDHGMSYHLARANRFHMI